MSSRPSRITGRSSSAPISAASAITSRVSRSRTWTATSGRPNAVASSESASGPASTIGRWLSRLSSAVTIATASSRPGACAGSVDHPQAGRLRGLVHPPAEQHRRQPVGDLDRALGQRRLRVAHQLQRAEPAQPSVGVERAHHVGRAQPFALEQLADEPRARQLARDVVLQVRVQAAVARVQLGRRAHRQHGGLEQIQPERLDDALQALVGVRRRLAVGEPQRDLVGDVQPAERIARIGIRAGDPLDRRHHAAVDEAERDRGLLRLRHYGAILSATSSASRSMESPGFETVSGPLVGAPRCCTTCASSCAISLSPSEVLGLYWSCAK